MFSALRTRYGIPGIISTIALIFAMTGGALAAKYIITSPKQIKPSVLKKLKGKAGPAGPAGTAGAQGPAGPAGANGNDGAAGAPGKNGESVKLAAAGGECPEGGTKLTVGAESKAVCNGLEGEPGEEGSPWTAGGTLPPGATETGLSLGTLPPGTGFKEGHIAISFPIPLAEGLPAGNVHQVSMAKQENDEIPAECTVDGIKGSRGDPRAQPGHFCFYLFIGVSLEGGFQKPDGDGGIGTSGARLRVVGNAGEEFAGTWAVTAPTAP